MLLISTKKYLSQNKSSLLSRCHKMLELLRVIRYYLLDLIFFITIRQTSFTSDFVSTSFSLRLTRSKKILNYL